MGSTALGALRVFAELKVNRSSFEVDLHVTDVHKEPVASIRQASDSHA